VFKITDHRGKTCRSWSDWTIWSSMIRVYNVWEIYKKNMNRHIFNRFIAIFKIVCCNWVGINYFEWNHLYNLAFPKPKYLEYIFVSEAASDQGIHSFTMSTWVAYGGEMFLKLLIKTWLTNTTTQDSVLQIACVFKIIKSLFLHLTLSSYHSLESSFQNDSNES